MKSAILTNTPKTFLPLSGYNSAFVLFALRSLRMLCALCGLKLLTAEIARKR